jgi:hypothetical protein
MWRFLLLSLCFSTQAVALSHISLTADSITHEEATLKDANISLDLTGNDVAVVDARTLQYGNTKLDKAHILLDLKANTTLLVTADHIARTSLKRATPPFI